MELKFKMLLITVKDRIAKTYGRPIIIDKLVSSSIWKGDNYWFRALKDGARQLSVIWGEKTELADDLSTVALYCVADNDAFHYEYAHLALYYYILKMQISLKMSKIQYSKAKL